MNEKDLEVVFKTRLAAQRHVLALVLSMAHREVRDPASLLDAVGRQLIADYLEGIEKHADQHASRDLIAAEYAEEISSITHMASQFAKAYER